MSAAVEHITIVGAGRVGASLAVDLAPLTRFGSVTVVGRRPAPPPLLAGRGDVGYREIAVGGALPDPLLPERTGAAVLLFCVPDDALAGLAARWGRELASSRGAPRLALHTSGVHPAAVLAPLRSAGAAIAGWHPLLALAGPRQGAFRSATFGVEGDDEATAWGSELARELGARVVRVRPEAKALYHAAAVFGANYVVACLSVAADLLDRSLETEPGPQEVPPDRALRALLPLVRSAVENVAAAGLRAGVTGPIVRTDVETVRGHLDTLDPATRALYRALGAALLRSRGAGPSDDEAYARLRQLLEADEGRG
ncbi:MAG: Rossmann-like and DUF2520 domain-containing protein [Gemmatimonadota bacterium]